MPRGLNKRWWGEVYRAAPRGLVVFIDVFLCRDNKTDCVEINRANAKCIAAFKSLKHAKEFCRLFADYLPTKRIGRNAIVKDEK